MFNKEEQIGIYTKILVNIKRNISELEKKLFTTSDREEIDLYESEISFAKDEIIYITEKIRKLETEE